MVFKTKVGLLLNDLELPRWIIVSLLDRGLVKQSYAGQPSQRMCCIFSRSEDGCTEPQIAMQTWHPVFVPCIFHPYPAVKAKVYHGCIGHFNPVGINTQLGLVIILWWMEGREIYYSHQITLGIISLKSLLESHKCNKSWIDSEVPYSWTVVMMLYTDIGSTW